MYEGDRTREDIVAFALRLMGPPVRTVGSVDEMKRMLDQREIAFAFIGEREGPLWVRSILRQKIINCVDASFFI